MSKQIVIPPQTLIKDLILAGDYETTQVDIPVSKATKGVVHIRYSGGQTGPDSEFTLRSLGASIDNTYSIIPNPAPYNATEKITGASGTKQLDVNLENQQKFRFKLSNGANLGASFKIDLLTFTAYE